MYQQAIDLRNFYVDFNIKYDKTIDVRHVLIQSI